MAAWNYERFHLMLVVSGVAPLSEDKEPLFATIGQPCDLIHQLLNNYTIT